MPTQLSKEIEFDTRFKFGDIVENYWAGEKNPHRKGIVVKTGNGSLYCTDGKGDFWNLVKDKNSKTKIIGHISAATSWAERVEELVEACNELDEYLSNETYEKGKPVHLNYVGAYSTLHKKIKQALDNYKKKP